MSARSQKTPRLESRLPGVGTSIFTVMSALAAEHGSINLGQGFPDFDPDPHLIEHVHAAMREGLDQYAPVPGVPELRRAIAAKVQMLHGRGYDPELEVTVTAGATLAILTALLCCVHPGDEVMVLEPCYDSYAPDILLAGGSVVRVALTPGTFRPDLDAIAAAITTRTRAIIINTPHNPSATIWTRQELDRLADVLDGTDVLLISDEVYEHIVFDDRKHVSAAAIPSLAPRAFVVSSFGKTYHVTGWKVGYVLAPAALTVELRKVHQFAMFAVSTPMQHGIARYMADPAPYLDLSAFYQRKRDLFRDGLSRTRLRLLPCEGSYFQCVDYSAVSALQDMEFSRWLTTDVGVVAIPLSAFSVDGPSQGIVRLSFAKRDETLRAALDRLGGL